MSGARWPAQRGTHCGNATFPIDLRPPLRVAWDFPVGTKEGEGECVGGDGYVVVSTGASGVTCLRVEDGTTVWCKNQARSRATECFFIRNKVFTVAAGLLRVRNFDPATGDETGSVEVPFAPIGEFVDNRGRASLLLPSYALDLESLETSELDRDHRGCVLDGRLFGGRNLEGGKWDLACRDLRTMRDVWITELDPLVDKEIVMSAGEGVFITHGRGEGSPTNWISARSMETGELFWKIETSDTPGQVWRITIAGGLVLYWAYSKLVAYCARSGKVRWRYKGETSKKSNTIVTGDTIWFAIQGGDKKHHLKALSLSSGQEVWSKKLAGKTFALACIGDSLIARVGRKVTCFRAKD